MLKEQSKSLTIDRNPFGFMNPFGFIRIKTFVISCYKGRTSDGAKIWSISETPIKKLECIGNLFLFDAYDYTTGCHDEHIGFNKE